LYHEVSEELDSDDQQWLMMGKDQRWTWC
jgi:hypothetical protein